MTRPLSELVPYQKYLVLHKVGNQRRVRSSCVTFFELIGAKYVFNARPVAGDMTLFADDILDFVKAPVGMHHYVNHIETITEFPEDPQEFGDECDHCGQTFKDGDEVTIVTDAKVFNGGEYDHNNTWRYHSVHVKVEGRS